MKNCSIIFLTMLLMGFSTLSHSKLSFYWTGVAGIYLTDGESGLMFDPVYHRPKIWQLLFNRPFVIDKKFTQSVLEKIPAQKVDAIFISHSHFDHFADAPVIAKLKKSIILGSITTKNLALSSGVAPNMIKVIAAGNQYKFGKFRVQVIESKHGLIFGLFEFLGGELLQQVSSPISLWDYKMGGAFSYFITHQNKKILLQQATRYTQDVKSLVKEHDFDVIFQGIANRKSSQDLYQSIWKPAKVKLLVPVHHDNFFFQLDDTSKVSYLPGIDMDEFRQYTKSQGVKVHEPMYYQRVDIP